MFFPGKPFLPSLIFTSKDRTYTCGTGTFKAHPFREGSCLTLKNWIRLERLSRDKHSSLFDLFVSDKEKKVLQYGLQEIDTGKFRF